MKQLITLSIVLLAGPSLASAQFDVTSGSMVLSTSDGNGAPFTIAGPGFSGSGFLPLLATFPLITSPFMLGNNGIFLVEASTDDTFPLLMDGVFVHDVEWIMPSDGSGFASAGFSDNRDLVLSGPGTYFSTFSYSGEFMGATNPGGHCPQTCSDFFFNGGGIVRYDVVPFPDSPGSLEISKVTYTFNTPEPSTASLLLIAFAGLAVLGWRRKSRDITARRAVRGALTTCAALAHGAGVPQ